MKRLGIVVAALGAALVMALLPSGMQAHAVNLPAAGETAWLCSQRPADLPWLRGSRAPFDATMAVQTLLRGLGYDSGPVDGDYGPVTQRAVRRFQTDERLTVDGVVGPQTWSALQRRVCGSGWQAPRGTTITITVRGCDGCTIGVQRALSGDTTIRPSAPTYWDGRSAKVRGGRVTLSVPTSLTPGMSFTIRAPWEGNTNYVANIVLGSGQAGARVSEAEASRTRPATACWAGTAAASARFTVEVRPVDVEGIGGRVTGIRAWASPQVATAGPLKSAPSGLLGNQDAFYC